MAKGPGFGWYFLIFTLRCRPSFLLASRGASCEPATFVSVSCPWPSMISWIHFRLTSQMRCCSKHFAKRIHLLLPKYPVLGQHVHLVTSITVPNWYWGHATVTFGENSRLDFGTSDKLFGEWNLQFSTGIPPVCISELRFHLFLLSWCQGTLSCPPGPGVMKERLWMKLLWSWLSSIFFDKWLRVRVKTLVLPCTSKNPFNRLHDTQEGLTRRPAGYIIVCLLLWCWLSMWNERKSSASSANRSRTPEAVAGRRFTGDTLARPGKAERGLFRGTEGALPGH